MSNAEKRLVDWLRDAHAMEQQAEKMLKAEAKRIENYPEVVAQLEKHIDETVNQTKQVEACLARYDEGPSGLKDATGKMTAMGQSFTGMAASDEIVKCCLSWYAFEQLEIGSYRILVAAADEAGDQETKRICEGILKEEEAMAAWLEKNTPQVVRQYLTRDQMQGTGAKH